ncbi:MAG TPA: glycosyltransferase family 4 protein [Gaiellaceae bacterium]|nr:glycosyltransferase family 4 protein [Gaiellaceae bacterium]
MKVLIVSGIWPPDVGGPASHAPEVAEFLLARGHAPHVLISAGAPPAPEAYPVDWVDRASPLRHLHAFRRIALLAKQADVVYTTGMFGRSGTGSLAAHTPYVVKLTADPAYERARRRGLTHATLGDFQRERSPVTLPLRAARDAIATRAAHVITPSAYLGELARAWGVKDVTVLPNPAPHVPPLDRDALRSRFGFDGPTLVFAGRLALPKSLEVGIEAAKRAGVALAIAGEGPERSRLEALGYARFLGPLPREQVLELFCAGDASLLSSSWENFPHSVVESLAAGTPVISTAVGGVPEVVHDGENGLLVSPNDVDALADAIRRGLGDIDRLRANARASIADYSADRVYGRLLEILERAAA